ncbi:MAG: hydantoinase/oxoprolinase family protein, partial [Synergistetes bacterium]|nr:hydantoinase/oxoprolinase family protein [Synergistota bacterium]
MGLRIGLDVGGTNVDAVIVNEGEIIEKVKIPIEDKDLSGPVWTALSKLIKKISKDRLTHINLSTTIATNAIVENKLEPVGMIIESGPGIDPSYFACGEENFFLSGYIDHRGIEVKAFDENEVYKAKEAFLRKEIKLCGVVTKFSVRNPVHEVKVEKLLNNEFQFISLGHKLSGKLNFPRRVHTTYLNSAIYPPFKRFYEGIKKALERERIYAEVNILKADGGTMKLEKVLEFPVYTILSGPAASILGALALVRPNEDGILMDIGGTTTDISFVADGTPLLEPFGIEIERYKSLVRSLYSFSIGLGGDSKVQIINGKIKIGPEREGPPKALGGPSPTPSDALITLGVLNFGNKTQAIEGIKELAQKL